MYEIFFILVTIFCIYNLLNSPLNAKTYLITVYGYIILAILLLSLFMKIFEKYNLNFSLLFGLIIALLGIIMIKFFKENIIVTHLLWLLIIGGMAIIVFPYSNVFNKSIVVTLILMLILTYIAYSYPLNTFTSWILPLSIALFGLIIFEIINLLFGGNSKIYSIIAIFIFMGFVLYDTQNLINNFNVCTMKNNGSSNCADYPNQSLGIFLDIINLFTNISNLQSGGKSI